MKKLLLLSLLTSFFIEAQSIELSEKAEISIITCGPGDVDLYSAFGHSAFRLRDVANGIDKVYNYGTFSFETENFYLKFVQGKLLYDLRVSKFHDFLRVYHFEKRWVQSQVLDLNLMDTQQVFDFLENNAKPENRSYQYDFFYDNCSTRLYDVLDAVLGEKMIFENTFDENNVSHRELIQLYLGNHRWGDFGIDLALGSVIDRKASAKEYMFLPDNVLKAFNGIKIKEGNNEKPIVKRTDQILKKSDELTIETSFYSPMNVFILFAIIVAIITFFDHKKKKRTKALDVFIFILTGTMGLVVCLLWFATDHSTTVQNTNIFWAFAPNLILPFILFNKNNLIWIKNYMILLLILLDIGILLWVFKVQIYSIAVVPILVALYIRYIYLWFFFKQQILKENELLKS